MQKNTHSVLTSFFCKARLRTLNVQPDGGFLVFDRS